MTCVGITSDIQPLSGDFGWYPPPGAPYRAAVIRAVFWDFGGVILTSPFDAFHRYETELGLPGGTIRRVNAADPHGNAWARLERNEIGVEEFAPLFEAEVMAAEPGEAGQSLSGRRVIELLAGEVRPEMVVALDRCKAAGLTVACLTNNMTATGDGSSDRRREVDAVMARFDVVVESSKVGVRKPEPRFYEIACELAGVVPDEVVFLDDLGINLKPAAAMGMTTIKVSDPATAIASLEAVTGLTLR